MRFLFSLLTTLLLLAPGSIQAAQKPHQALSPDGKMRLEVTVNDQKQLVYRVFFDEKPLLDWSTLGFQLNTVFVGQHASIAKQTQRSNKAQFGWPLGENDVVQNNYREMVLDCRSGTFVFKLITRVFDGSVAFRYAIPKQKGYEKGLIRQETTTFNLADSYTIYQYNEESIFTPVSLNALTRTCDFPATLTNGKRFISIGKPATTATQRPN
jgi:alpha-glucosidase